MKYYLIAGEASGDLHGSNLVKELKKKDPEAQVRAWGGDLMSAAGADVVKHYKDLAFMGFAEVVKNLPTILSNIKWCKSDVALFNPDVLVLIDYPGFNLRIARWAKEKGFKVVYYISPQVWAWKESRVKLIRKVVDKMLVILPFEKEFYETKWDYKVEYVGHPLVQVVNEFNKENKTLITQQPSNSSETDFKDVPRAEQKKIVALLPGSRRQEIAVKLPIMLQAGKQFPQYRFIIAQAPGQPYDFYLPFIQAYSNVEVAFPGQAYAILNQSAAALVTSGTATLETALFGVPQVVCYKGSAISYHIAKRLITIKYISLVNLIANKPVVTELIQHELTVENVVRELEAVLHNPQRIATMKKDYADLKALLQQQGNASAQAAESILQLLHTTGATASRPV